MSLHSNTKMSFNYDPSPLFLRVLQQWDGISWNDDDDEIFHLHVQNANGASGHTQLMLCHVVIYAHRRITFKQTKSLANRLSATRASLRMRRHVLPLKRRVQLPNYILFSSL